MKYTQNKKIAFALWFLMSVLFIGTPSPLMIFLPGIFVADALHLANSAASGSVIILFGSILNLMLYLWVADLVDKKKLFSKKNYSDCKSICNNSCTEEDKKTEE